MPSIPLSTVWQHEDTSSLFLYVHIPFCEHRCGFCNLFTQANPEQGLTTRYLFQLRNEAERLRSAFDTPRFTRMAIGGGTPTFLDRNELTELFTIITDVMGVDPAQSPTSIEVSPATVDLDKLLLLRDLGVDRISIGIQSFDDKQAHRLGRPQCDDDVQQALELIQQVGFPRLNIDLIYGGEDQSNQQWLTCLQQALQWQPQELYLYPLYVRALTGLGRMNRSWDDHRLEAYRSGRDFLKSNGYQQNSMRMFQQPRTDIPQVPAYCCQSDGMIGLGCGARSYTRVLHYSTEYAVGRRGVQSILLDYLNREVSSFDAAQHGYVLSAEDQQRRYLIMSVLQSDGLSRAAYQEQFGNDIVEQLPECIQLETDGLAIIDARRIRLTPSGIERSDQIGPALYSHRVRQLMTEYEEK